ncbi:MAG: RIP metalloprotease [Chloroflexi bacterium]|nr:RIP metalloprotease [Chloroflexota bacterium]
MTELIRTVVTIFLFFGILGVLVVIHELGHFIVAKLFRVRVLEFGIGFPPRARVLRDVGETVYTLNWLPIGGFVKLEGEDGEDADDPRSFSAQGLTRKILILVAGVVMNVALAAAIFTGIALTGDPAIGVYVPYVEPGSPAEAAGIRVGDVIERVDGQAYGAFGPGSVLGVLHDSAGRTVALTVRRSDEIVAITATLRTPQEVSAGKGALGVGKLGTLPLEPRSTPDRIQYPVAVALGLGLDRTASAMRLIVDGVGQLATAIVTNPTEPPPASGPIGIATQIGDIFWTLGPIVTLYLAGILSANLAVVNILPFPPLDGGRILILILKRLAGSRLSLRMERLTYVVGFAVLLLFLVWVTGFDIARGLAGG